MAKTPHTTARPAAYALASASLAELLAEARTLVLRHGQRHETQRGETRSLSAVTLTWRAPERDTSPPGQWQPDEIAWYLRAFVAPLPANDPTRLVEPGVLLFPYTYAARARFWDGGWGALHALVAALAAEHLDLHALNTSRTDFLDALARLGERLHLQTVLSLVALYPPAVLAHWLAHPTLLAQTAAAWRRDLLAAAIADIAATPASRRAIVAALSYPQVEEQLQPRMGLPPYQLFQFLPGAAEAPLSSIHVHRSLDAAGGAPLDFHHDLAWLREGAAATGRPVGEITIVAHDLHAYASTEADGAPRESIAAWLCRVTDGYPAGAGTAAALLREPAYLANAERIWARWQEEGTR